MSERSPRTPNQLQRTIHQGKENIKDFAKTTVDFGQAVSVLHHQNNPQTLRRHAKFFHTEKELVQARMSQQAERNEDFSGRNNLLRDLAIAILFSFVGIIGIGAFTSLEVLYAGAGALFTTGGATGLYVIADALLKPKMTEKIVQAQRVLTTQGIETQRRGKV